VYIYPMRWLIFLQLLCLLFTKSNLILILILIINSSLRCHCWLDEMKAILTVKEVPAILKDSVLKLF